MEILFTRIKCGVREIRIYFYVQSIPEKFDFSHGEDNEKIYGINEAHVSPHKLQSQPNQPFNYSSSDMHLYCIQKYKERNVHCILEDFFYTLQGREA